MFSRQHVAPAPSRQLTFLPSIASSIYLLVNQCKARALMPNNPNTVYSSQSLINIKSFDTLSSYNPSGKAVISLHDFEIDYINC